MKHNIIGITVACNEVGDPRFFCLTEVIERFFGMLYVTVYILTLQYPVRDNVPKQNKEGKQYVNHS